MLKHSLRDLISLQMTVNVFSSKLLAAVWSSLFTSAAQRLISCDVSSRHKENCPKLALELCSKTNPEN
jgi:hypothetical protein